MAASAEGGARDPESNGGEKPSEEPEEFDPSRMIGIIKRKAFIKEITAAYHAECLACCKELLQFQRKWEEEQHAEAKMPEEPNTSSAKPLKRRKR
ncbi:uncharacterized protein LOC124664763 [Lolium rigidum]|uniref:uncharacterized protein LOC124664763 n=1 Tax=Lolium rigidum TaxID=89674 RepID=UPI001F5DD0E9|nr:uncharacterized protein LOC124664763 [Lolium rigidum]